MYVLSSCWWLQGWLAREQKLRDVHLELWVVARLRVRKQELGDVHVDRLVVARLLVLEMYLLSLWWL